MIRGSLIEFMRRTKIKNLSNGQKLMIGLLLIAVKKAKVIVDIRKENKIHEENLMALIKKVLKQHPILKRIKNKLQ